VGRAGLARARSAFMPTVGAQAGVEWNGNTVGSRERSWFVGAEVRVNLFNGFADRARLTAAQAATRGLDARREAVLREIRLDVLDAHARLVSAAAQVAIGRDAAAQAAAAHQIVRDRYEHGLVDITTMLESARAVADADSREVATRADAQRAAVAFDRALGRFPR
jgi:outer membrane protein